MSGYGCWGDNNDPYFGGRYYAKVLKQVYPKIKAANPEAKVLIGGLVLDCDPDNPPANKDCKSTRYFEGILVDGGGAYFDVVSIHAYHYFQGYGKYDNYNWHSGSKTTGPVLIAKTRFIKDLLARYSVGKKEIMATEIAIVCISSCGNSFQETKSYYVAEAYAASIIERLSGSFWYYLYDVWLESGLVDETHVPTRHFMLINLPT